MSKIQEAFAQFYTSCSKKYAPSRQQQRTASSIINCRTAALGANTYVCDECSHLEVHYNSCRNRHCPSCQGVNRAVWIDARSRDILNAPYFHVVFTMPKELQRLIYQNQELLYVLMYKAVGETISELCWEPKYLGAQPGFFSILHTWGQDLHYHPHIHTVVLAGGLTRLNQWRSSSKKFFIPVKVLAKKFRGKFLYYLKQYYRQELLRFYESTEQYREPKNFQALLDICYAKDWYTYTKRTFSGPLAVVKYLGRYTHRIAISNTRIVSVNQHDVRFTVKDYKNSSKTKLLTLSGVEFIRRFLMHILPKGFVKIRYYGILANRNKKTKLLLCRKLTRSPSYEPRFEGLNTIEIVSLLLDRNVSICPACSKGTLKHLSSIYPGSFP
ncbi:MAG: IS91 family transposase [Candidatus Cloacimonetes bacterium]|jgi:hypothetical protein|nr:IS91 family transposase [Candidatus Cloacimonadota bacterium]MCK9333615.1 IS91 family transposase [Candidatus Cloacimonadota bacterium]